MTDADSKAQSCIKSSQRREYLIERGFEVNRIVRYSTYNDLRKMIVLNDTKCSIPRHKCIMRAE